MSWRKPSPASLGGQVVETARRLVEHRVVQMSAALAYYSALSLAPLVVITLGVTGLVMDREIVHAHFATAIGNLLGAQGEELIRTVGSDERRMGGGGVATAFGIVMLTLGASAVFAQLQDGLNAIWEVASAKGRGLWHFLRTRLISFAMVFCLGFLLLVSMLANAVLSAVGERLGVLLGIREALALPLHLAVTLAITTVVFAVLFKVLPDARVAWREAWTGAVLTAVLFQLGAWAIGQYIGRAGVGSAYGAAGSIVVLLVWVFYASLIVFSGAEFAHVRATAGQPRGARHRSARAGGDDDDTRGDSRGKAADDAPAIGAPLAKARRGSARGKHRSTPSR